MTRSIHLQEVCLRAVVLSSSDDIRIEERPDSDPDPDPVAGSSEVLVRLASAGVYGSNLPRMLVKNAIGCR